VSSIRIEHPDGKNGLFQAMIGSSLDDVGLLTGRLLTARADGGDSSFTPQADQLADTNHSQMECTRIKLISSHQSSPWTEIQIRENV
jgi:hypothetical protein